MSLTVLHQGKTGSTPAGSPRTRRSTRSAIGFLTPATLILSIFVLWPVARSFWVSLTNDDGFTTPQFVGLDNYVTAVHNPRVEGALIHTAEYALVTTPVSIALAVLLALCLNQRLPFRGLIRAAVFLPFVASLGITAIAWTAMLDPQIGFLSGTLSHIGIPLGDGLRDPSLALPLVMAVGVWRNVGFFMILYLAGLQSIPKEVYEAARLDGASRTRTFRSITWPLLANTTMFAFMIAVIFSLQVFDQIYVMTAGGPYFKSETLVMLIFDTGINNYQLGYASALSWILIAILLVASGLQLRLFKNRTVQY
ncbi:sugar ABC transporter permease [Microbispora sp. NPDC046933]|uniref:carbohydrate ABC transporter permease n=1 Tax=Microbispora sp. NPDC046933 TaxID=3155618 RepID=UPI0033EB2CCD